jgi:2-polyprenyl-3-methyl-5-hydroxy-6-metoxy-1,4-benzoquinol methylase
LKEEKNYDYLIRGHGACGDGFYPHLKEVIGESFQGKRILDLGSNAGIISIRAVKEGASADCIEALGLYHRQFDFLCSYFGLSGSDSISLHKIYVEQIDQLPLLEYDIVLALAIMYHVGKLTVPGRAHKKMRKARQSVVKLICEKVKPNGMVIVRNRQMHDTEWDHEEFEKYDFYPTTVYTKSRIVTKYEKVSY